MTIESQSTSRDADDMPHTALFDRLRAELGDGNLPILLVVKPDTDAETDHASIYCAVPADRASRILTGLGMTMVPPLVAMETAHKIAAGLAGQVIEDLNAEVETARAAKGLKGWAARQDISTWQWANIGLFGFMIPWMGFTAYDFWRDGDGYASLYAGVAVLWLVNAVIATVGAIRWRRMYQREEKRADQWQAQALAAIRGQTAGSVH